MYSSEGKRRNWQQRNTKTEVFNWNYNSLFDHTYTHSQIIFLPKMRRFFHISYLTAIFIHNLKAMMIKKPFRWTQIKWNLANDQLILAYIKINWYLFELCGQKFNAKNTSIWLKDRARSIFQSLWIKLFDVNDE